MPGIASTETIDFVTANSDSSECTLYIIETDDWGHNPDVDQLNKKLNSYLSYALDGQLQVDYLKLQGAKIAIRFDLYFPPSSSAEQDLITIRGAMAQNRVSVVWVDNLELDSE
jgi:hypothetical protein